ncbi:type II toxin-antitoxin system Phd/YefM family antitoxin [Duganella aceris]|uniref:Antitoxin n=1 Tax=Duganella aceris TaxID=2703883 RepID=A0ABX0FEP9_9BURK|nr:type II toxin-antitoxin system Phd/YefM family antitoxin [Duganella aceris]NGZ83015.1 type II toxin-antitoxin system prevent-host-death family antitoxin [Duganella aceris]
MNIISFSETGNDLRAVLEKAAEAEDALTVLREDGSSLVILTLEQYNGLMATSHLLSSPLNAAHLVKSLAELHAGQVTEHELIEVGESHAQPPVHK